MTKDEEIREPKNHKCPCLECQEDRDWYQFRYIEAVGKIEKLQADLTGWKDTALIKQGMLEQSRENFKTLQAENARLRLAFKIVEDNANG